MKQLDFNVQQLDLQDHHHQQSSPRSRGRPRRQPHLIKGSLVEVRREEDGLKGAWYEAIIIKLQSFAKGNVNAGRFYVEYKTLFSDEDDSKPLRGYISATCIRPAPPVESLPKSFDIDDLVDAYYSDGWRKGVITKTVEGNRFVVTFFNQLDNQPGVGEFGPSDLRFHREWVNGSWVPPVNQTAAGLMPNVGRMRVEVSFDTGGSQNIWYPAIILEVKENGIYSVEYHKCDGNGGSRIAKADVDSLHFRPCPPQLKDKTFTLLEKVDAFYEFGWWSGVITKELAESRYIVFFKHTKTEREFLLSELRPHMEWKDGKWKDGTGFFSSKDVSILSDYNIDDGNVDENGSDIGVTIASGSPIPTKSTSVENMPLSSISRVNAVELVAPASDEPQVINSSPREMTLDSPYSGGKETLNGEAHAAALSMVINASNYNVNVASAEKDSFAQPLGTDPLDENNSSPNKVKRKRETFAEKEEIACVRSKKTREKKVQAKSSENSVGMDGNEADGVTEDIPGVETNLPVVLGLACDNSISFGSKLSSRSNGEGTVKRSGNWYSFDEAELHSVMVTNQFEVSNGTQKKRRGRPRKSLTSSSITPMHDVEVATSSEVSALGHVLGTNGSCEMLLDGQIKQENQSGLKNATSPSRIGGGNAVEASIKQHFERNPTKRGRKKTMNLNSISKMNDVVVSPKSVDGKTAEASCMTEETERVVTVSLDHTLDNQPLSKWFGDLNSPPVDSSRSSLTRCIGKTSQGHMEISKEEAAVDEIRPKVSEPQKLPFEKNSPIWAALKSMEVFHKLPQKPHFKPLESVNENGREGLAIGLMVTFTGVVDKTSKLKFDDPRASIDDFLETLLELETHGFDVGVVRARISDLGRLKEKQEKLQDEVKKLSSEMAAHEVEKGGIDEEIEEINSQIKALQVKLSKAMSLKEAKNREVELLQSKLMDVQEGITNIRCEFEENSSSWI